MHGNSPEKKYRKHDQQSSTGQETTGDDDSTVKQTIVGQATHTLACHEERTPL